MYTTYSSTRTITLPASGSMSSSSASFGKTALLEALIEQAFLLKLCPQQRLDELRLQGQGSEELFEFSLATFLVDVIRPAQMEQPLPLERLKALARLVQGIEGLFAALYPKGHVKERLAEWEQMLGAAQEIVDIDKRYEQEERKLNARANQVTREELKSYCEESKSKFLTFNRERQNQAEEIYQQLDRLSEIVGRQIQEVEILAEDLDDEIGEMVEETKHLLSFAAEAKEVLKEMKL